MEEQSAKIPGVATLRGLVTNQNLIPIPSAKVTLTMGFDGKPVELLTDAHGGYMLPVAEGDWMVTVNVPGFIVETRGITVTHEGATADFKLTNPIQED